MQPEIDFESMRVGDSAELSGSEWETGPQQQFAQAQAFTAAHPDVQFQVDTNWRMNKTRGIEERRFVISRIR